MNTAKFTHTTYQTEVEVWPENVMAVFYLPTMKSIVLVGPGSTAIPVVGTQEEIVKKLTAAKKAALTTQEGKNGT